MLSISSHETSGIFQGFGFKGGHLYLVIDSMNLLGQNRVPQSVISFFGCTLEAAKHAIGSRYHLHRLKEGVCFSSMVSFSLPPLKLHHLFGRNGSGNEATIETLSFGDFLLRNRIPSSDLRWHAAIQQPCHVQAAAVPEDLERSSAEQPLLGTQDWNLRKIR